MNLPNKLTILRMCMVPFYVFFLLETVNYPFFKWIALGLFIVASLTDLLDGVIARKYNMVTNFGKFMDPLADKLLVCSALIGMTALNKIPAWITIVIIAREFIISGYRLVAAEKGVVIAASMWGKWKTTFQMVMLCLLMVVMNLHGFSSDKGLYYILNIFGIITMYVSVVLTIISLVDYFLKNKSVLKDVN